MTGNDYQEKALRTASILTPNELILNGVLGLNGEAGEIADIVKKSLFQGHELDKYEILYELGDIMWYVAIMAKGLDTDLDTVMNMNIEKLMKRYPDGFDSYKSINRE